MIGSIYGKIYDGVSWGGNQVVNLTSATTGGLKSAGQSAIGYVPTNYCQSVARYVGNAPWQAVSYNGFNKTKHLLTNGIGHVKAINVGLFNYTVTAGIGFYVRIQRNKCDTNQSEPSTPAIMPQDSHQPPKDIE